MSRPTTERYFIRMAKLVATRSTCLRRSVGCVLVDKRNHVLSTGYNGVASGVPHCNHEEVTNGGESVYRYACPGATAESGTRLDECEAIHAEQNALLQCPDVYAIETAYVTVEPCVACVKLLLGTGCKRVVFASPYTHGNSVKLWRKAGRKHWVKVTAD